MARHAELVSASHLEERFSLRSLRLCGEKIFNRKERKAFSQRSQSY